jgi:glycerol-3-phosphate dehydrogenase
MHQTPPPPSRAARLAALGSTKFDLLVIGGGITGAGVARDAARRGLSVALVDADDFAAGTSSRSSRLIHGGVRYLEHGYLHLVFEASRERRRLLKLSPHLARPLQFTWPVYNGARVPRWKLAAGLTLYDTLALFRNVGRHRRLSARGILEEQPALESRDLKGGAAYWDAATDDSRLTLANVLDASAQGAVVVNHARVQSLTFASATGPANGAVVRDALSGAEIRIFARLVLNTTGPWTDEIAKLEESTKGPAVRGTKGVHIAVPSARVGNRGAVTMLSPDDGRVMFTLPSTPGITIIGTTDTQSNEHPHEVRAARADVLYLLSACNRFFPAARLTESDVISAWAGIRPLVAQSNTGDPASASREHSIQLSKRGVLTVTGGKLTTYRAMAEQIVDAAIKRLGASAKPCDTTEVQLPGQRPAATAQDQVLAAHLPWRERDVDHAVEHEFAESLADVLIRRTTLAFELPDQARSLAPRIAARIGARRGWTATAIATAVADYERDVTRIFGINP